MYIEPSARRVCVMALLRQDPTVWTKRGARVATILLFVVTVSANVWANAASSPGLTDAEFTKETIAAIREITLQLILIAMGVFAIVGGFLSAVERAYKCIALMWLVFISLGISVAFGLLTFGNLVWSLGKHRFEPFGVLESLSQIQWIALGLGGVLFALFVLLNLKRAR